MHFSKNLKQTVNIYCSVTVHGIGKRSQMSVIYGNNHYF